MDSNWFIPIYIAPSRQYGYYQSPICALVGQGGADPPTPLGKSFTDSWSCRFPTDPYFSKKVHR